MVLGGAVNLSPWSWSWSRVHSPQSSSAVTHVPPPAEVPALLLPPSVPRPPPPAPGLQESVLLLPSPPACSLPMLLDRSSRDRPPPYKRWKGTGDNKGERDGAAEGSEGKATERRRGEEHRSRDREAGAARSKSWSNDRSGECRRSENRKESERREGSEGKSHKKRRDWEGGVGRGHHRMEVPPPPGPPPHCPHGVNRNPNPWLSAGAPHRTYPPPPPPPPPPGVWRNRRPEPPPLGTLRNAAPPPPSWNRPPAALRNPAAPWGIRKPSPPPPGTLGNPEDFPPLPGSGPPPQTTQSQGVAARPLQRQWEDSPTCSTGLQPPGCGGAGGFDFSVMSYNILSQDLLQENAYLYRHCDPSVLPWDFRLPNLLGEIQQYDADVLCLQEVQRDHYEAQMKPALEALGYTCVYKKRTGKKPEGCAVVFKSSRLSLVSAHPLEYLRPGDTLLDRDNVGLVLLLRPTDAAGQSDPSDFICVANTHLLYNPRRGDIKLAQLAILLAEISRRSRLPDGSANPVVVCGDFNSTPRSPLYSFLTQGCLEFKGMPIGMVSGQEDGRGQRVLTAPIWSKSLGINQDCRYDNLPACQPPSSSPPGEVEGAIAALSVKQLTAITSNSSRTRLTHSVGLQSSYSHLLMPDGRAEITTCHSRTAMTVDYILYTPDSMTSPSLPGGRGLQLLARLSLVGQSELKAVNGLPNQHHSSDHLPILARFRLRR
ncbi:Protein angel 2 [Merluccius polli]|uniref:Protein angel 2 n=1 Tax=Merluccius polli TaxID=89951 RepID=A0AA47NVU3_MERPO|nr:Protein angel 2 [Merluccius polli]